MPGSVSVRLDEDVAVITLDNPPVNALGTDIVAALGRHVAAAAVDPQARAIVVAGAGRTFVAGADIKALEGMAWGDDSGAPDMHETFRRIEDCRKPVVMALHGSVLGGGLELAMAGHFRVASADAALGQPEVNLGLIPGAEGTQRLPRLVGVAKALEMCVTGAPIGAREALAAGLVDQVVEGNPLDEAVTLARERAAAPGPPPRTRDRNGRLPARTDLPALVHGAELLAAATRPHLEAPRAAIEAVAAAATLSFEEGCRRERALFFACARSEQAKALIHAFFAERAVSKVPGHPAEPAAPVRTVGIVAAGSNRDDIAAACAHAGLRVIPESAGPEALAAADVVIEAAFEHLDVTRRRFADLDRVASAGCLLATKVSAVDLDLVAAATSRPERVVGLHFPYPADKTRLVEIVPGRHSSPRALASSLAFAKRLGKVGVVVGNAVGDRLMQRYVGEALLVTEAGVSPQQVDRALGSFGMTRSLFAGEGRLAVIHPDAGGVVESQARHASGEREALSDDAVVERLVLALVNEGARVVDEGVASRAADIDVICMAGYGFPAFRGGPMFYADRLGLEHVCARLAALHARHGPRWQPAPLLVRLCQRGRTFRQHDADAGAPTVTPPA